jgi:serine/threonine-protein kinase HipA
MLVMSKCLYCYKEIKGEAGIHAKCAKLFFGSEPAPAIDYTFDQMTDLAKDVVERSVSVPGVQAKLSMSLVNEIRENSNTLLTVVGALGGNYIFKPPNEDYPEMTANEHLTMRIAEAYGIKVVPSGLIKLKSGELSYITKRIDRTEDGNKIHMIDMFQITEAFDKYKSSMEKIGKAINSYAENTLLDKLLFFELSVFCFLTGNNDMHLKNFSLIKSKSGWSLSPAYDLLNVSIVLPEDTEELALTISGKKRKLKLEHFESFGKNLGLTQKQVKSVFKRFLTNKLKAVKLIKESFLSEEMKHKYLSLMDERYSRMYADIK